MRRGNKSHKVPNVKLRPPPPPSRTIRVHDPDASADPSSDSEVPPNASMADFCPRPFTSFTVCATGTMDKPTLFKMAFELGATSTSDFTDRVTHLIASSHGGAKYMCALERKIPIMTPDWITEAHAIWLRGDDVDVERSVSKYRLPVFSGVILSLSGVEDVQRRTEINRLVTAHQGTYLKNLERPVRVTHLLCSGDIETDKMKYAEKFNKRKEAHIHLVWEEWFWDCLEFGGRFDERKYQVSRPRPERKSLHEIPKSSSPVQDSAPGSHPSSAIPVDDVDQPKRLKSVVPGGSFTVINNFPIDDEEEEMAIVNKPLPAVTLQLWQSLLKPRGFELDGGKLIRSPSKSQAAQSPPSTSTRRHAWPNGVNRNGSGVEPGKGKEKESVISSFRRAQSFAPVPVKEPAVRQPFCRNTTCPAVFPGEEEGSRFQDPTQPEGEPAMSTLFAGYTFRLLGEARCTNVRRAIENGGGGVTDDDVEEPCFIIVRLISGSKLYRDEFDDHARTKYRTECWLEHSVFHERICEPDENVSFTPLKVTTPVPDAEKIKLSLSGLDQSELCWIRRLVRAVGITLEPTFSRRSTHLLCPSGTGAKFDKALEWRIPVVSLAWLEGIARTGTILHLDGHLVGGSRAPPHDGLFGKPRLLTHNSDPPEDVEALRNHPATSSPAAAPPLSSSPHFSEAELPLFEPTPPVPASPIPAHRPSGSTTEAKAKTVAQTRANTQARSHAPTPTPTQPLVRIPSSTSPSPMKLPSSSLPSDAFVSSPACLPDTDAITKALHESLTSLLGKRPIAEEDPDGGVRDAAAAGPKKGKRARPGGPSSIASRNASRENVMSPVRPAVVPPPVASGDLDMSLFEGLGIAPGMRSTEESTRVTYEDPEQAEEKRRLLRMLGGDEMEVGTRASGAGLAARGGSGEAGRTRRPKRAKVVGI